MRSYVENASTFTAYTHGVRFGDFVAGRPISRADMYLRGSAAVDIEALASAARDEQPVKSGSGLYLYWTARATAIGALAVEEERVLYVGMTADGLAARNHMHPKHSGFSTLRHTLGALLQKELGLHAMPRSLGSSRTNSRNYRFDEQGEASLSRWMEHNLKLASVEANDRLRDRERVLIQELAPMLNLTGWANPDRKMIMQERLRCSAEAAKFACR